MGKKCDISVDDRRNIIVVYLKEDLVFWDLVPLMKEYIDYNYEDLNKYRNRDVKKKIDNALINVKNLFDEVYKAGMTLYSDIHGRVEVEILAYALKPFYIRTGHLDVDEIVIIVLSDKDIIKTKNMYNEESISCEDLAKEIEDYVNSHIITEGEIKRIDNR
jgi:hypothetical protein